MTVRVYGQDSDVLATTAQHVLTQLVRRRRVGTLRVEAGGDPDDETLVRAKVTTLDPTALSAARQSALDLEKHAYAINANGVYQQTPPSTPRK